MNTRGTEYFLTLKRCEDEATATNPDGSPKYNGYKCLGKVIFFTTETRDHAAQDFTRAAAQREGRADLRDVGKRVWKKLKRMETSKIAPLAVYLASDAAADVTGQIFGVRANEIFLFSQNRPLRSVQRSEGWTPETIANHAIPALRAHFYSLDRSQDVFTWDPV